jgi:Mg-chelatase subunit ChlD
VKLLGDGSQPEVTVTGDRLLDFAQLKQIASAFQVNTPVRESKENLLKKLWSLEEGGQTALGPALACSIFVAAQSAGSSVLLATDGLANKGIGTLEDVADETTAAMFYQEMGEQGRLNGVTVSIVSLIGTEARLETLSVVCEATRGLVDRVEATKLAKVRTKGLVKVVFSFIFFPRTSLSPSLSLQPRAWR